MNLLSSSFNMSILYFKWNIINYVKHLPIKGTKTMYNINNIRNHQKLKQKNLSIEEHPNQRSLRFSLKIIFVSCTGYISCFLIWELSNVSNISIEKCPFFNYNLIFVDLSTLWLLMFRNHMTKTYEIILLHSIYALISFCMVESWCHLPVEMSTFIQNFSFKTCRNNNGFKNSTCKKTVDTMPFIHLSQDNGLNYLDKSNNMFFYHRLVAIH